ncbi:MAG: replication protein RepA [Candidatus Aenigmarchaeota archaeon]|nr:replication protein RepA [Candidatus Aenigmarchaeota archaeon]
MPIEFKIEPAVKRKISEINPNLDSRISLIGKIIDIGENLLVLDDGTGKINISFSEEIPKPELKIGNMVRIFGFVIPSEQIEIQAEIIQDMSKLKKEYLEILRK